MTTPIAQQFAAIKREYPDCLLLFALPDGYYAVDDDATTIARTLAERPPRRITLPTGEQFHAWVTPRPAAESRIATLIAAGHKVAVCEQLPRAEP